MLLGAIAVLAYMGNPKNMAMCIACFIRDTAGAMKLHQAAVVQYVRPEIIGIICGAFLIAVVTKEYRSTAGSSPMVRFVLGMIMMIGSLAFLGCPLRMVLRYGRPRDCNADEANSSSWRIFTGTLALKRGFSLEEPIRWIKPRTILPIAMRCVFLFKPYHNTVRQQ